METQPVYEGQRIQLFTNEQLKVISKTHWFYLDFGDDLTEFFKYAEKSGVFDEP